jgi:YfiH family protein
VVSVTTADCVPILLVDEELRVAAAIHSGWKGTVANIVGATVKELGDAGVPPSSLRAAVGPCIYREAFEVGEEVAAHFEEAFVFREGYAKPHVDLLAVVLAQLRGAGLVASAVETVGSCTHASPDRFFSYRRDGVSTGQALSFIGFLS